MRFPHLIILTLVLAATACTSAPPQLPPAPPVAEVTEVDEPEAPAPEMFVRVSVDIPAGLETEIQTEVLPARPLKDPTHKPDYVNPRRVEMSFGGKYGERLSGSFFPPEIVVYPIDEFEEAWAVNPEYRQLFKEEIDELRSMIGKPRALNAEIPFIPYVDAAARFQSRVRHLKFSGGSGLAFVGEYGSETTEVDPRHLAYIFQGITEDGRFLVVATLPFDVTTIPDGFRLEREEEFAAVNNQRTYYYRPERRSAEDDRLYARYSARVASAVENPRQRSFAPKFEVFDALIRRLRVESLP